MTHRARQVPRIVLWPDGARSESVDVSPWVESFTHSKQLGAPLGRWSVSLLPYAREDAQQVPTRRLPDLYRRVRPNGLVSLGMEKYGGIGLGLIDSITRTRHRLGGRTHTALTLTGSCMGKTLYNDNVVQASLTVAEWLKFNLHLQNVVGPENTLLQNIKGVWGPTDGRDGAPRFVGQSVEDVIRWIVDSAPSMQVPLLASQGGTGRPGEFLNTERSFATWNGSRVFSEAPHDYQGNVWGFLKSILDEDVYEIWLDTIPRSLYGSLRPDPIPEILLVVRPKPFDEASLDFLPTDENVGIGWNALRTLVDLEKNHVLEEDDVYTEQLGCSDADSFAYYMVTSQHDVMGNQQLVQNGLMFPAVDTYALVRSGLRQYHANLSLILGDRARVQDNDRGYDSLFAGEVTEFRNRLFNWYRLNAWFENGSLTVRGRDHYRVGDPVLLPWLQPAHGDLPGVRFYTQGVTHSWAIGERYQCLLDVARGHNDSTITAAKAEIALDAVGRFPGITPNHLVEASR